MGKPRPTLRRKEGNTIFFQKDTPLPTFIPLPRFLLQSKLSVNAKLLYGLLLSRTTLSQKSGWISEEGHVYVIYPIDQMAEDLGRSKSTVKTVLNELEREGLIFRARQGWQKANRIYLCLPDDVQFSDHEWVNFWPAEGQKTDLCRGQNLSPSNTEREETERIKNEGENNARYGQYGNVRLSPQQLAALQRDYPTRYSEYIERLSAYMEIHHKRYANHSAVIRKWLAEDNKGNYDGEYEDGGDCL